MSVDQAWAPRLGASLLYLQIALAQAISLGEMEFR